MIDTYLAKSFWGNTVETYVITLATWFIGFGFLFLIRKLIVSRFEKWLKNNAEHLDFGMFISLERALANLCRIGFFYIGYNQLTLSKTVQLYSDRILLAITVYYISSVLIHATRVSMDTYLRVRGETLEEYKGRAVLPIIQGLIWLFGFIFILDNFGFQVSSILAGLGVAGIAVGLAAQAVLGDLFSYFAILLDRPFRIGDHIIIDNFSGILEHVGLKTSRLRSIDGEQIVMSNSDLTNSRVRNYRRMKKRRSLMTIGVTYQTPHAKLQRIPDILKEAVNNTAYAEFDRANFSAFGAYSLDFELAFFIHSSQYAFFMEKKQYVMLNIVKAFEEEDIEFAYPTQTLFVNKDGGESC